MISDFGVEDEVSSAIRVETALGRGTAISRRDRRRFIHTNRKEIIHVEEVVLVTLQETMYMDTPCLGLDALVYHAQKQHPEWGFTVVELRYNSGHYVPVVDRKTDSGWQRLEGLNLRDVSSRFNPSIVGLSSTSKGFNRLVGIVHDEIDTERKLVVAGGVHPSIASDETFDRYRRLVDVFIRGDGVKAFRQILDNPQKAELADGAIRKEYLYGNLVGDASNVFHTSKQPAKDFAETGIVPAQHQRTATWAHKTVYRLQTATGCTYGCSFCAIPNNYQTKSVKEVRTFLDSVITDMTQKGLRKENVLVFIEDGNFGGPKRSRMYAHASDMLELFEAYNLNFGVQLRYDNITDDYLERLERGHVNYVFTSVESVDAKVLLQSRKGQKGQLDEIYATFRKMHDKGIEYAISFISGLEGDSQESFMQTANFVRDVLTPKIACEEIAKVYPKTVDAERYEATTGINVERAYCTGKGLVNNPLLGSENNETLLLIPVQEALISLEMVSNLFSQRAETNFGFNPIVPNAKYIESRTGFFQRIN
ncbi:MAG: radical SAM protein [Candidatus Woesearchaeota archaeon]|jgi:hypothetical protein